MSKEESEEDVCRQVSVNKKNIQDLVDHCKYFGFYSEQVGRSGKENRGII